MAERACSSEPFYSQRRGCGIPFRQSVIYGHLTNGRKTFPPQEQSTAHPAVEKADIAAQAHVLRAHRGKSLKGKPNRKLGVIQTGSLRVWKPVKEGLGDILGKFGYHILISILVVICLRRYCKETCRDHGELSLRAPCIRFFHEEMNRGDIFAYEPMSIDGQPGFMLS